MSILQPQRIDGLALLHSRRYPGCETQPRRHPDVNHIGPYEVLEEIAQGAMAIVYRGRDPMIHRDVAIKVLLGGSPPAARDRFLREAKALGKLRHPNIVAVQSAGLHQGQPYLVMDLVEGPSLQEQLHRAGPLDPDDAADLVRKLADALDYIHSQGILHRDVKPDNILLTGSGEPLLTDLGLVKDTTDTTDTTQERLSQTGGLMGTPGYWPPEQASGELTRVGVHSDVYSLGATLYACLTGQPPFYGTSLAEMVIATREQPPTPPSRLSPPGDRRLDSICLRCLEKEPQDRYLSAAALASDLEVYLRQGPKRSWLVPGFAAALGILVTFGLVLAQNKGSTPQTDRRSAARKTVDEPTKAVDEPTKTVAPPTETVDTPTKTVEAPTKTVDAPTKTVPVITTRSQKTSGKEPRVRPARRPRRSPSLPSPRNMSEVLRLSKEGTRLVRLKQYEGAMKTYDRILELEPNYLPALLFRGNMHNRLKQRSKALADFLAARAAAPDSPQVAYLLGSTYLQLKQHAKGIEALTAAIELKPTYATAYKLRAEAYEQLGQYELAIADYENTLKHVTGIRSRLVQRALNKARGKLARQR
jgi:serine/threonine protein kinase